MRTLFVLSVSQDYQDNLISQKIILSASFSNFWSLNMRVHHAFCTSSSYPVSTFLSYYLITVDLGEQAFSIFMYNTLISPPCNIYLLPSWYPDTVFLGHLLSCYLYRSLQSNMQMLYSLTWYFLVTCTHDTLVLNPLSPMDMNFLHMPTFVLSLSCSLLFSG